MPKNTSRRDLLKQAGAAGAFGVVAGSMLSAQTTRDKAKDESAEGKSRKSRVQLQNGAVIQPQQEAPVIATSQVLVVGGGVAGICAALGARKSGADVVLVERYGQLGGTFTAGISPTVAGTHLADGKTRLLRGIGGELLERLAKMDKGILGYDLPDPTIDVESAKYLMQVLLEEAGVQFIGHGLCIRAVMEENRIQGIVCDGKQGRVAMLAKVTVDATGDGDVLAFAGAAHTISTSPASLGFRVGNLDRAPDFVTNPDAFREKLSAKLQENKARGATRIRPTPLPDVEWINQHGLEINPLNVEDLTRAECFNRDHAWKMTEELKKLSVCKDVELLEVAWTLGIPVVRILDGIKRFAPADLKASVAPDTVGLCPVHGSPVPYGILLPKNVANLIVAGRAVSAEGPASAMLRSTAGCMITGHAAGVAAAIAAKTGKSPADIDIQTLKKALLDQGAFLGEGM